MVVYGLVVAVYEWDSLTHATRPTPTKEPHIFYRDLVKRTGVYHNKHPCFVAYPTSYLCEKANFCEELTQSDKPTVGVG